MASPSRHIRFNNLQRNIWIAQIVFEKNACENLKSCRVVMHFGNNVNRHDLEPVHLVTLACLIEHIYKTGNFALLSTDNADIFKYIFEDLGFQPYWSGGKNHVDAVYSSNIFNLWRIIDSEKDMYAKNVETYLRSTYLNHKDLSSVNVCLVEAFYNVFDHAQANGIAFSLLSYDEKLGELRGAICDFGRGITHTIKKRYLNVKTDVDAIELSIKTGVTAQSTDRNKGFGMGNIVENVDTVRIMSGNGIILKKDQAIKKYETTFSFPGTLIYFDINLSQLDDEVVIDSFNW